MEEVSWEIRQMSHPPSSWVVALSSFEACQGLMRICGLLPVALQSTLVPQTTGDQGSALMGVWGDKKKLELNRSASQSLLHALIKLCNPWKVLLPP